MDRPPEPEAAEPGAPEDPALEPGFLDPESPRYQPWAEKQIFNASKEKRPLAEFLEEFGARIEALGGPDQPHWDREHNARALARFVAPAGPQHPRRHRRAGTSRGAGQAGPRQTPQAEGSSAGEGGGARSAGGGGARRRRRRGPRGRGHPAGHAPAP
ncbi:MAG: hypothetical protein ACREOD_02435 [Candidatus Dormibacteria bacterium]